jgi:hypothetical protein
VCVPDGRHGATNRHHGGERNRWNDTGRPRREGEGTRWNDTAHGKGRGHLHWGNSKSQRGNVDSATMAEDEVAAGTVAGAAIAFLALLVTAVGVYRSRLHERQRLTYEVVGRLEDLDLMRHKALTSSLLRGGLRPPETRPMSGAGNWVHSHHCS